MTIAAAAIGLYAQHYGITAQVYSPHYGVLCSHVVQLLLCHWTWSSC